MTVPVSLVADGVQITARISSHGFEIKPACVSLNNVGRTGESLDHSQFSHPLLLSMCVSFKITKTYVLGCMFSICETGYFIFVSWHQQFLCHNDLRWNNGVSIS